MNGFLRRRVSVALGLAVMAGSGLIARAANLVTVQNEAGFEGLEEASVMYYPDTNTFVPDSPNFPNHIDEGNGLFRDILRNQYVPGVGGWWDGDRDTTNTDRQRTEAKGIVGLGHQQVEQTFEYSFDFRTNPTFTATSSFDHIFQLKATNGDNSPPLATISLYKSGSGIQGRVDCFTDGTTGTTNEIIPTTFSYTAGQWIHFVIRITPCAQGETTGAVQLSVNGGAFAGVTNAAIDLTGSTDYRPKFGFYRGISTTAGVPLGESWVEHRTVTGFIGSSNVLTWKGGVNGNTWDTSATQNFLNSTTASVFALNDEVNFTDTSSNTTVTLSGNVAPNYTRVNATANYTFSGSGALTGGTLRKEGTGTLTLATNNSYPGLTDVRVGTLFVTGSIGNNSLVSITGGTLKTGSAAALGTDGIVGTEINGGTLDINGFNLSSESITVQGSGVGGGAIVNTGANQTSALNDVTLSGNSTFGGSGRWDIRGSGASLSTGGSAFTLTKTGVNQVSFVGTNVDAALGNITVSQGILGFQTSTTSMGDPAKTISVAAGATLEFYNSSVALTKVVALNGGTIWGESGSALQNNFAGAITLSSAGGTLDAGSALSNGTANPGAHLTLSGIISSPANGAALTKNGPGTVTLTNPANAIGSPVVVNAGTLVFTAPIRLNALTLTGTAAINVATLILEPSAAGKFASGTTLQNELNGGVISSATTLSANVILALLDNAVLNRTSFAGLPVDGNSLIISPELLGDANADGTVDLNDLNTVLNNLGQTTTAWTSGNFDGAATIDLNDLNAVLNHLGTTYAGGSSISAAEAALTAATTPEPGTLCLGGVGVLLLVARRRRTG